MGWVVDQPIFLFPDGSAVQTRLTAVLHQEGGAWKLVHMHLSVGVPDEEVVELRSAGRAPHSRPTGARADRRCQQAGALWTGLAHRSDRSPYRRAGVVPDRPPSLGYYSDRLEPAEWETARVMSPTATLGVRRPRSWGAVATYRSRWRASTSRSDSDACSRLRWSASGSSASNSTRAARCSACNSADTRSLPE